MNDHDGSIGTIFRDVIFNLLIGFVALVLILLPYINPDKKQDDGDKQPGNLIVEIVWPARWNTDVDLWVKAPGQRPVGYSNKNSPVFDLLRDDLGTAHDKLDANYEFAFTRGLPQGTYVVNLHLYRNLESKYPVPVEVTIKRIKKGGSILKLLSKSVLLEYEGRELTVFSFDLDDKGNMDPQSISSDFIPLRNAR